MGDSKGPLLRFNLLERLSELRKYLLIPVYHGLPGGSDDKESVCNAGDAREAGMIPGSQDPLEKEMATHSSTLAYKIPWIEESGGLLSMGFQSWTRLSGFTSLHIG